VDFDKIGADVFAGSRLVFCCLGSTRRDAGSADAFHRQDHDVIMRVAKAAKEGGVEHFSLVSSVGVTLGGNPPSSTYLRSKALIEQGCIDMGFTRLSIFRPSVLDAQRGSKSRSGERCAVCISKWLCCLCRKCCCRKYDVITVEDVARTMIVDSQARGSGSGIFLYDGTNAILHHDCELLHVKDK